MRQLKITQQITQRSEGSINRYFQDITRYQMISAEEEVDLTQRIRKGDAAALDKLVVANLRFVISVAKQYQNQGLSFPDLINEGNMGLVKAAGRFDETRGFKFISYAVWWIRQSIVQAISDQTRIVRLPLNRITSINKIKKAIPQLVQEFEREPTDMEIADHLGISSDEVTRVNGMKKSQVSFDMPLSNDGSNDFSLYDMVQTEDMSSPDDVVMKESVFTNVTRALSKLTLREAEVLTMSFGLGGTQSCSLSDIALKYEMTSERVRQIRNRGLGKLKVILKDKYAFLEQ
ncbi:MAG: RNA polymerase sigma factor RpoD/SigA [Bacteroidetes bacterium]|nr:RNA polymerase sigma factor RpoD/SigA [Bacteroidota bacterium]